jgi:hypothetical protein
VVSGDWNAVATQKKGVTLYSGCRGGGSSAIMDGRIRPRRVFRSKGRNNLPRVPRANQNEAQQFHQENYRVRTEYELQNTTEYSVPTYLTKVALLYVV